MLICDDTVLKRSRSKKIELVKHQYAGNAHDVIATNKENTNRQEAEILVRARWCVEVYHREIKKTCDVLK